MAEPAEVDGLRPMGAVRDLLDALVRRAHLDEQQQVVVRSLYGLSNYPSKYPARPLSRRVPRQRGRGPLGERHPRSIAQAAMVLLEAAAQRSPIPPTGYEAVAGPVSEPSTAPWFVNRTHGDLERLGLIGVAVDAARAFVATTGITGQADQVLREIDTYHNRLLAETWPPPRPIGRSRARAVIGLALWEVTQRFQAKVTTPAWFDPPTSGALEPPDGFTIADVALGALLKGTRSDEVVTGACTAAIQLARRDRVGANVVVDLLLGALAPGASRAVSAESEANILRTAVRIRSTDEDPTVTGLVHAALTSHGNRWQTIDTLQSAVKVASAYGRWEVAEVLCDEADAILADHPLLPHGRDPYVEGVEYGIWTLHQRSATDRRRVDSGGTLSNLASGLRSANEAERMLEKALFLHEHGAPGDVTIRWRHDFSVRRAELHILAADRLSGRDRAGHRQAAEKAVVTATEFAGAFGLSGDLLVPLTKVRLQTALVDGEGELAAALLRQLHDHGWPLRRSLPLIFDLVEHPDRRVDVAPPVREAVEEITASEDDAGWSPAASDSTRKRQGRPLRS